MITNQQINKITQIFNLDFSFCKLRFFDENNLQDFVKLHDDFNYETILNYYDIDTL
jgi:hypothetical protein